MPHVQEHQEGTLGQSEELFRLLVSSVKDYAILMLDPHGHIASWNEGAERIKGYRADEIIGRRFSVFYPEEDIETDKPGRELSMTLEQGRIEDEGWRLRKDGSRFWANVVISALRNKDGGLYGFAKVTRDMTERKLYEDQLLAQNTQLNAANKELEAFSYSVSHDLRAPLRSIDGFSKLLLEDYVNQLDASGADYLQRIRNNAQRMATLIDDMLNLSRLTRTEMRRQTVDLTSAAAAIVADLQTRDPERRVTFRIAEGLSVNADAHLLVIVLENLLNNAWKFTSKREQAEIELGSIREQGKATYFIRDNGAGFDPQYADKLFGAFQRLHGMNEFPGTGVGLATVQHIINRHGGRVWADAKPGAGATFYFTLG